MSENPRQPVVSVVMANRNGAAYVGEAVRSVLAQSLADLELLFIDDASDDESVARATEAAAGDPRLKITQLPRARGPGGARNQALNQARGRWIAVVDSDDAIAPERLERLVVKAHAVNADMAADNQLLFSAAGEQGPLLRGRAWREGREVRLAEYIASNRPYSPVTPLGLLKPVIRRAVLERSGAAYDEALRIGEDYDLVARLMAQGARFWIDPLPLYRYRKHPHSTSHRWRAGDIEALLAADDRFVRLHHRLGPAELKALRVRRRSLERALAYDRLIQALKSRAVLQAAGCALAAPSAVPLLLQPVAARLSRLRSAT